MCVPVHLITRQALFVRNEEWAQLFTLGRNETGCVLRWDPTRGAGFQMQVTLRIFI